MGGMSTARQKVFAEDFLQRLKHLHLLAKRLAGGRRSGQRRSRRIGDGLEFADHRTYSPGDDPRFIDWPYFARMDKLLIRLFHEHSEAGVVVLVDASASMAPDAATEKFHYALHVAAALAFVASAAGDRVLLQPFGETLGTARRVGRNQSEMPDVLDFLASLEAAGRTRLDQCARGFAARSEPGATVLLISDLQDCDDQLRRAVTTLTGRRCEVTLVHVHTPAEQTPQAGGHVELLSAEGGARLRLDITERLLEGYRQQWEAFVERCRRACVAAGATYVRARTDVAFEQLVLVSLRRAGVLGR